MYLNIKINHANMWLSGNDEHKKHPVLCKHSIPNVNNRKT